MSRIKFRSIDSSKVLKFENADKIRPTQDGLEIVQILENSLGAEKFLVTIKQFIDKVAEEINIENIGAGVPLLVQSAGSYSIKSLVAGDNITLTPSADTVIVSSSVDGVVTGASFNPATQTLTLTRSNSLPEISTFIGGGDGVIDGANVTGTILVFTRTEGLSNVTVDLGPLFTSYVNNSRLISTSGGLTGGGDLTANRVISIAAGGVTNDKLAAIGLDISKFTVGTIDEARLPFPYVRKDADSVIAQGVTVTFGTSSHALKVTGFATSSRLLSTGLLNFFTGGSGQLSLKLDTDVQLHYQGSPKLTTTNTGVTVTGTVTASPATLGTHLVRKDQVNTVTGGVTLETKVIEIGTWDMDALAIKIVSHGLANHTKIRSISVMVTGDSGGIYPLGTVGDSGAGLGSTSLAGGIPVRDSTYGRAGITATDILIFRKNSDYFDTTEFNSTAFNRGWITITYEV